MSLMPEEFPVIMAVFLAIGAWRLSKVNVLVRQTSATENLGAITILCVDKTGTLTMNQMTLAECRTLNAIFPLNESSDSAVSPELMRLIENGVLASQRLPFDPMEKALIRAMPRRQRPHLSLF